MSQKSLIENSENPKEQQRQAVPTFLIGSKSKETKQEEVEEEVKAMSQVVQDEVPNSNFTFQVQTQQQPNENYEDELKQEFQERLMFINSLRKFHSPERPLWKEEWFSVMEEFLQDERFQNHPYFTNKLEYVQCWIDYASMVKDPHTVYDYMFDVGIGKKCYKYYLCYVFHTERLRDFNKTEEILSQGMKNCEVQEQEEILKYFQAFSERMAQRIQRDLIDMNGENNEALSSLSLFRKRRRDEAFPDEDNEDSIPVVSSKKMKTNEQVNIYKGTVQKYIEGIKSVKLQNPSFKEMTTDDRILMDYDDKPLSFLNARNRTKSMALSSDSKSSKYYNVEETMHQSKMRHPLSREDYTVDELRVAAYKQNKEEQMSKMKQLTGQNSTRRSQYLESIGEASMDMESNMSIQNQSASHNFESINRSNPEPTIQEEVEEDSGFITANQSIEAYQQPNRTNAVPVVIENARCKTIPIQVNNDKPTQNLNNNVAVVVPDISQQLQTLMKAQNLDAEQSQILAGLSQYFKMMQQQQENSKIVDQSSSSQQQVQFQQEQNANTSKGNNSFGINNNNSKNNSHTIPSTQLTDQVFFNLSASQPTSQPQTNDIFQNLKQSFFAILAPALDQELPNNKENYQRQKEPAIQANSLSIPLHKQKQRHQYLQQHQQQQQQQDVKVKDNGQRRSFSNIFMSLIENGEKNQQQQQQDVNQQQISKFQGCDYNQHRGEVEQYQNGYNCNNISYLSDTTNQPVTPNNIFTKFLNQNYSQENFLKKSSSHFRLEEDEIVDDDSCCIQSPFGLATPVRNQMISQSRQSQQRRSIFKEASSFNWANNAQNIAGPPYQQQQQHQTQLPQPNVHQSKQVTSGHASNSRMSIDSQGQEFKDCIDTFGEVPSKGTDRVGCVGGSLSKNVEYAPLPSYLTAQKQDAAAEINSRNTSKSVRFQN